MMHCPLCKHPVNHEEPCCPNCGYLPRPGDRDWMALKIVYPPDDIFVKSMLESFGIPVKLLREAIGPVQGLTFGPLAEVKVMVPLNRFKEAKQLLEAPPAEPEDETVPEPRIHRPRIKG